MISCHSRIPLFPDLLEPLMATYLPYMNVGKVKNQGFEGTIRYESSLKK